MSEQNQNRNNRSGGNGGNRNRNQNRRGGQGGGQGGNRSQGGNRNNRGGNSGGGGNAGDKRNELQPSRGRRPRKKPLTFWQKCLKAVGLYKETDAPAKGSQQKSGQQNNASKKQAAKKSGRVSGGGRVEKGQSQGQREGQKPRQPRKKTPPPTKVETPRLYVGNLSYDATEYDLEELFKGVGAVRKVELVYNRHTHKSKGYGFVNMANMEEAERAVEVLHDQPFMGRKMIVNGARSKGPNDSGPKPEANGDSVEEPKQESAPTTPAPASDVPAEEEVHSLAPDKPQ
ncbi:MAG: RNA recognition motif domain-containing protein [Roseibacillus sp.]